MRHQELIVKATGQRFVRMQDLVLINPGELFVTGLLGQIVKYLQCCLRRPAEEQRGGNVFL